MIYNFLTFIAVEACPGNMPLQNNICPDFECIDDSSCNFNGVCNNKECDCKNGFTGIDCAFDLKGDKLIFDMELNTPVHQLIQTKMIYFMSELLEYIFPYSRLSTMEISWRTRGFLSKLPNWRKTY